MNTCNKANLTKEMMNRHSLQDLAKSLTSYDLFSKAEAHHDFDKQGIKNIHTENPISALFFSRHNIEILQNGIRYMVYKKTENSAIIDHQSENELLVIMRSIYLQYCDHKPYEIISQVKDLNSKVLDYAVPVVLVGLNQYVNYKNDASQLPIPLEHSVNMSSKGTKILYNQTF